MSNPVMVVHDVSRMDESSAGRACWVWCPACDDMHRFQIVGTKGDMPDGPCWEWDGNLEKPTFQGSMLVYETTVNPRCHSFLRDGIWEFLGDCTHDKKNQKLAMVPLPDWFCK